MERVEITVGDTGDKKVEQKANNVVIIPKSDAPGPKVDVKNYYYGLGIEGAYETAPTGQLGYVINRVAEGYNGEAAGLKVGDIIVLVNGEDPLRGEISGEGPKALTLGVLRNNIMLTIITERGKVYY